MKDFIQILPDFDPYAKLKFCSNTVGVKYLLCIKGFYPIIIGKGDIPEVWLYAIVHDKVVALVDRNKPQINQVEYSLDRKNIHFTIFDYNSRKKISILTIDYSDSKCPNIVSIDLRPLGILCYGSNSTLHIGDNELINNTVTGVKTFIEAN